MFPLRRMAATAAGIALAGGTALAVTAPAAGAATYTNTSLQSSGFTSTHIDVAQTTGTATVLATATGDTYTGPATVDGCAIAVTAAGALSATAPGAPTANAATAFDVSLADTTGDVEIVHLTFAPTSATVCGPGTFIVTGFDVIALNAPVNDNTTGNVNFSTTPGSTNTVAVGNRPAGVAAASGNVLAVSGDTAIPGTYNGITAQAKDAAGAVANGKLRLKVNGSAVKVVTHKDYTGAISNFYSGKCLDTAWRWFSGGGLVQWACGSSGGANQRFELYWTGSGYELRALDFTHPADTTNWVVTTDGVTGHELTLKAGSLTGTPPAGQLIVKSGAYYTFAGTAQVINNAGYSTSNGGWVIGWPKVVGATNEQWSLP